MASPSALLPWDSTVAQPHQGLSLLTPKIPVPPTFREVKTQSTLNVLLGPHSLRSWSEKHLRAVPLSSQSFPSLSQPTSQHLSLGHWRDGGHGSPALTAQRCSGHSLEVARQPPSSCEDLACGRGSSPHSTALYFLAAESVLWDTVWTLFKLHPKEEAEKQRPPALANISLHFTAPATEFLPCIFDNLESQPSKCPK